MLGRFLIAAAAAFIALPAAAADAAHAGTWRIDASRSSFSNMPFPANMSLTLTIAFTGDGIRYHSVNDTDPAHPSVSDFATTLDGTPAVFPGQERFDQVSVLELNPHEFRVLKLKAGDVIVGEFWTFLPDGRTLRRRGVGKNAEGRSRAFEEFFTRVD